METIKSWYNYFTESSCVKAITSIPKKIQEKTQDQDFMQKVSAVGTVGAEMYRVMVSSFLIIFVPQKCGDHVCTYKENLEVGNNLYISGIVINFVTMASLLWMYSIELKRENRLITYLDVNKNKPSDNESVGKALKHLSEDHQNNIWSLDKWYQRSAYWSMVMFTANTILSGFVIYEYYLDGQTTTTYVTNNLFMITKLMDVYSTVSTDKNIFYSAYLKGKVQFNDVDPQKYINPSPVKKEEVELTDVKVEEHKEEAMVESTSSPEESSV